MATRENFLSTLENLFSCLENLFSGVDKIFSRHGIFLGNIRVPWRWDCVAWESIPVAQRTTAEMLGAVGRAANEIKKQRLLVGEEALL